MILGSGVYRIGSSVEFDWSCVNAAQAAQAAGFETIMVNYNPETVSTDYDTCTTLLFDEISLESVVEACERERPAGVVVSMGGQLPNNLAIRLAHMGVPLLGTTAANIDRAEDRSKFSALLDRLGIEQPRWEPLTEVSDAEALVERLGGFPVLVRPSYVLSGAAMSVAHEPHELQAILARAKRVSPDYPVVVSKFETHAREIEIDAVADKGKLVLWAICEHIENAGVHSGDATMVLPPQMLYLQTIRRARQITAAACERTGHHRSVQRAVHRQEQRRQGDRVQSACVAQPALRQQGSWRQFRRRGDALHAWRGQRHRPATRSTSTMSASRRRCSRSGVCTARTRCRASRWQAPAR